MRMATITNAPAQATVSISSVSSGSWCRIPSIAGDNVYMVVEKGSSLTSVVGYSATLNGAHTNVANSTQIVTIPAPAIALTWA